ncbi:hypothetical protein Val02_78260 [Virgisporangium aliadipatigenens]|uniref:Uncharacterized protein n=1 Tax=Virgisporangium aliadipatigenens TaxID=741659 RepID=A0A8J3YW40_9ACTN|nr:hypothetical protein Val02_78260 [Virgisporangium aliadipatigenens]
MAAEDCACDFEAVINRAGVVARGLRRDVGSLAGVTGVVVGVAVWLAGRAKRRPTRWRWAKTTGSKII